MQEGTTPTTCSIIGTPTITEENVKYNCNAPKEENSIIDQIVVHPNLNLQNADGTQEIVSSDSEDINFSEEAIVGLQNLQNQDKEIDKYLKLQNGELLTYSEYFIIKGDINDYDGKVGDTLNLIVYDNSTYPSTQNEVSCRTQSVNKPKYEFRCTPTKDVKGIIYLSPMYIGDTSITLNMTEPNSDYVNIKLSKENENSANIRNNPKYRKSSSGLSGGAIAGIIIACGVALIIASIVALILRKSKNPVDPEKNTSSVMGLRAIDSYTQ